MFYVCGVLYRNDRCHIRPVLLETKNNILFRIMKGFQMKLLKFGVMYYFVVVFCQIFIVLESIVLQWNSVWLYRQWLWVRSRIRGIKIMSIPQWYNTTRLEFRHLRCNFQNLPTKKNRFLTKYLNIIYRALGPFLRDFPSLSLILCSRRSTEISLPLLSLTFAT